MSAYLYAIIPYKSGISFSKDDYMQCVWCPILPELKGIESEFVDPDGLSLFKDFLLINTCYRLSAFTNNKDGFNWIRAEVCLIAKALGASEVWYVEENITDQMDDSSFSFDDWVKSLSNEKKKYLAELSIEILKGNCIYSYYHDDFSDIIMERPTKEKP